MHERNGNPRPSILFYERRNLNGKWRKARLGIIEFRRASTKIQKGGPSWGGPSRGLYNLARGNSREVLPHREKGGKVLSSLSKKNKGRRYLTITQERGQRD